MTHSNRQRAYLELCAEAEALPTSVENFLLKYTEAVRGFLSSAVDDYLQEIVDDETFNRTAEMGRADARALHQELVANIHNEDYAAGLAPDGKINFLCFGNGLSRNQAPIMAALAGTARKLEKEFGEAASTSKKSTKRRKAA